MRFALGSLALLMLAFAPANAEPPAEKTGLKLGDTGFLTLSGEARIQQHTTRAGPDPRQQYAFLPGSVFDPRDLTYDRYVNWYGDPKVEQYTGYANAGYDLANGVRLYGWASYQSRDAI